MKPDVLLPPLIWARMQCLKWTHWRPFVRAARNPKETQERLLRQFVNRNRDTYFGREHGFGRIGSYQDFAAAVPVQSYETLRPYIEKQRCTRQPALNSEMPVMYAQTSGTTGAPKLIPLLAETLREQARNQAIQSVFLFSAAPQAFYGRILAIVSPAVEGTLDCGTAFGSASGQIHMTMPQLARSRYIVPDEVFSIADYELKYLVILRLALACDDLSLIATANPSTLLKLLSLAQDRRDSLLTDLRHGTFYGRDRLSPKEWAAIEPRLQCEPGRVIRLESALRQAKISLTDLWPNLSLVCTWTGGNCAIPLAALKKGLSPNVRIAELGYLSSELRATITVDIGTNAGMPTIQENFFEFVERGDWEDGRKTFLTVDALEDGKQYYVIVTTGAGLYRYFMNDIVAATGRFEATAAIRFVQKGKGVTSITGEKLYESQLIDALRAAEEELQVTFPFFLMLADAEASVYRLIVEWPAAPPGAPQRLAEAMEEKLSALNLEYAQKRASGRLRSLDVLLVRPGTGEAYKRQCLAKGQREGQFKMIALQYRSECEFSFEGYAQ